MAEENPDWGAPKIHGELQKLGFVVCERSVARYLRRIRFRGDPGKRWMVFLQSHREVIVAFGFFTAPTVTFRLLYCFFVIEHGRRKILHLNVTRHPSAECVVQQLRQAFFEGTPYPAGLLHVDSKKEDVPLMVRLDRASRSDVERIQGLKVAGRTGRLAALNELVKVEQTIEDKSIYHKNLMPVTYVTGDVAGTMETPVYAILKLGPEREKFKAPEGYAIEQHVGALPTDSGRYSMKRDGEWHLTYEVFRDLGIAFAAALILICALVVGWFQSFVTPLIIMAAIPFSLAGILPAHGMMNAFFTATPRIGSIAGAGIVVRNSIILVDFVELRLQECEVTPVPWKSR